jgi:hypothetical protein
LSYREVNAKLVTKQPIAMTDMPIARKKRTSYENFVAECPSCGVESIFNRASDLSLTTAYEMFFSLFFRVELLSPSLLTPIMTWTR